MNATTSNRQALIQLGEKKCKWARQAHQAGDQAARDGFLTEAAEYYEQAGLVGLARWCRQWLAETK